VMLVNTQAERRQVQSLAVRYVQQVNTLRLRALAHVVPVLQDHIPALVRPDVHYAVLEAIHLVQDLVVVLLVLQVITQRLRAQLHALLVVLERIQLVVLRVVHYAQQALIRPRQVPYVRVVREAPIVQRVAHLAPVVQRDSIRVQRVRLLVQHVQPERTLHLAQAAARAVLRERIQTRVLLLALHVALVQVLHREALVVQLVCPELILPLEAALAQVVIPVSILLLLVLPLVRHVLRDRTRNRLEVTHLVRHVPADITCQLLVQSHVLHVLRGITRQVIARHV